MSWQCRYTAELSLRAAKHCKTNNLPASKQTYFQPLSTNIYNWDPFFASDQISTTTCISTDRDFENCKQSFRFSSLHSTYCLVFKSAYLKCWWKNLFIYLHCVRWNDSSKNLIWGDTSSIYHRRLCLKKFYIFFSFWKPDWWTQILALWKLFWVWGLANFMTLWKPETFKYLADSTKEFFSIVESLKYCLSSGPWYTMCSTFPLNMFFPF